MGFGRKVGRPPKGTKLLDQMSEGYRAAILKWQKSPEWQKQVRQVLALKEKGFEESDICAVTDIEDFTVRRILEDEESNKSLIRKHWEEKIPTIRDIIGLGLNGIKECLTELQDPDIRRVMIKEAKDLAALTKVVTDLNMLLRLEENKSTQNVAVNRTNYGETRVVLQNLAKVDPVFQYALDEPKKED